MTEVQEICDIAKETIEVLRCFDISLLAEIPKNSLYDLEKISKKSKKVVNIDREKKLIQQNISEESKDLISLLYYNYCANEKEKEDIIKIWKDNELLYQKELKEKYDLDKALEKRRLKKNYEQEVKDTAKSMLPVVVKENMLEKIKRFLKKIF